VAKRRPPRRAWPPAFRPTSELRLLYGETTAPGARRRGAHRACDRTPRREEPDGGLLARTVRALDGARAQAPGRERRSCGARHRPPGSLSSARDHSASCSCGLGHRVSSLSLRGGRSPTQEAQADARRGSRWSVQVVRLRPFPGGPRLPPRGPDDEALRSRAWRHDPFTRTCSGGGAKVPATLRELPR